MPDIFAPTVELGLENGRKLEEELKKGVPGVYFPQFINYSFGFATGYSSPSYQEVDVEVFWDLGVAVVNKAMPEKERKIWALNRLGYRVLRKQFGRWGSEQLGQASQILWEEMRAGFARERIKENLEALLSPILASYKGVKEFEFAVYNPDAIVSSDDVFPEYIEYDKVFSVQANERGTVDFEFLVNRLAGLEEGKAIAFSSRVLTNDGRRHIPMIDFKSYNVYYDDALRMLQRLGIPFKFLVFSSKGFQTDNYHHYYAGRLMDDNEFNAYLSVLKKQPEVGETWAKFQEEQGFSLLRVAPSATKLWFPEIIEVTEKDIADANKRAVAKK